MISDIYLTKYHPQINILNMRHGYLLHFLTIKKSLSFLKSGNVTMTSSNYSTRHHSAVSSESDCRSRGCEFDPGLVPYFLGD